MASTTSQYVISALPGQGYNTLFCPDLDELLHLPGVLIDEFRGSSTPTKNRTLYPQALPATEPDFELNIVAPRPGHNKCKPLLPTLRLRLHETLRKLYEVQISALRRRR